MAEQAALPVEDVEAAVALAVLTKKVGAELANQSRAVVSDEWRRELIYARAAIAALSRGGGEARQRVLRFLDDEEPWGNLKSSDIEDVKADIRAALASPSTEQPQAGELGRPDLEICTNCDGSGEGVADTTCGLCNGLGGVPAQPQAGEQEVREALFNLVEWVGEYRSRHDTLGDGHTSTGQAWDFVRRAVRRARAALSLPTRDNREGVMEALQQVAFKADRVMTMLENHGSSIVPHLLDSDDNAGQRLRLAIWQARNVLAALNRETPRG
jgi:hypothetical protein